MKKRLFLYTTLILFAGLLSCFAASVYVTYTNNFELAKDAVTETARLCAALYQDGGDISAFVRAGYDTRITVIAPEGAVLADSRPLDVAALENHLDRPEIEAAAAGAPAAYIRYSDTVGADLIYYALKVNSGGSYVFIRTAIPVKKIDGYLIQSLPLLVLSLFIVALLCFFFSRRMIQRVTRPFANIESQLRSLAGGEYTPGLIPASFEEINTVTRGIDEVARLLRDSFQALRGEKAKLDYILNNIGDGLFAVDETKSIVLINTAALRIFNAAPGITEKNLNYLSYDKTIAAAVDDCVNSEKSALFEIALNGHIYFTAVKRLPETLLTMVVLSDVTENRENAKRREEFFANASHELKTPLTAIKGFNELTAIHSKDEALRKYIDGIARETDRMLALIGDMLKLSELENTRVVNLVPVSLATVIREARETLEAAVSEKAIRFEAAGDAVVTAGQEHVYGLVKNLIENAVRYTGQNGNVTVTVEGGSNGSGGNGSGGNSNGSGGNSNGSGGSGGSGNSSQRTRLVVSDDGVGISPGEQARIFERFYRVEKSRAPRNGGTGLGLAIVKHICLLYGWELTLKSKPGIGTEVTVVFDADGAAHKEA